MSTINELESLYSRGGWRVRLMAVKALGSTYNPIVKPTIYSALDDNDSDVRAEANRVLRNF